MTKGEITRSFNLHYFWDRNPYRCGGAVCNTCPTAGYATDEKLRKGKETKRRNKGREAGKNTRGDEK